MPSHGQKGGEEEENAEDAEEVFEEDFDDEEEEEVLLDDKCLIAVLRSHRCIVINTDTAVSEKDSFS